MFKLFSILMTVPRRSFVCGYFLFVFESCLSLFCLVVEITYTYVTTNEISRIPFVKFGVVNEIVAKMFFSVRGRAMVDKDVLRLSKYMAL